MSDDDIRAQLDAAFRFQLEWVERASSSGWYRGEVVHAVWAATSLGQQVAEETLRTHHGADLLDTMKRRLDEARRSFGERHEDEDGYGSLTLDELIEVVKSIMRIFQVPRSLARSSRQS